MSEGVSGGVRGLAYDGLIRRAFLKAYGEVTAGKAERGLGRFGHAPFRVVVVMI